MAFGLGQRKNKLAGAHVLITGGSSGIGLALAHLFVHRQASITIVARSKSKLEIAVKGLQATARACSQKSGPSVHVQGLTADVTDYRKVLEVVAEAEERVGPVDIAVCCAGASYPGRFLEQDISIFHKTMELDYFGCLHVAKAVLPRMLQRDSGRIVFVASPMAAIGFVGFTTYSPAKFAVRGLADALRNEFAGTNVGISIGYPLDTATPGFDTEMVTKPPETDKISRLGGASILSSEESAQSLIRGIERGQYHIKTSDFIVNLLLSSMSNITPKLYPTVLEILLAPLIVIILAIYGRIVDGIVVKSRKQPSSKSAKEYVAPNEAPKTAQ